MPGVVLRNGQTHRSWPLRSDGALVLGLAILTSALTGPGQTIGVSVFIDHFVDDLDLTRSQVSGAYMIGTLGGAALLPAVGRFIDHRGVRVAQILVGVLFSLALVNMAGVNGLLWLTVGFVGIRFFGQGSLSLVSVVTVSLRFVRRRGTALGIYSTASSALMATLPLALAFLIGRLGWRATWLVVAAVVAATVIPIAWFGLRTMPTGQRAPVPAKRAEASLPVSERASVGDGSYDRPEAIRTWGFWLLVGISGSAAMLGTALNFHQIDLLGQAGLSATAAAALFIPQVIGSTLAGLGIGWISDHVGTRYLPAAGMALLVAAHWMAAIVAPGILVITYAIVLGAMGGAVRTATSILLPAWFGIGHLGAIQGSLTFFNVVASALGPVALAVVEGYFDSYPPAVLLLSLLPLAALLITLGPAPRLRPIGASAFEPRSDGTEPIGD